MGNAVSATARPLEPTAETSSSCVTQGITAAHNFEVLNFSLLEGMGVGEFVTSRSFRVGGHDWSISVYPDGSTAEHENHVSVYLVADGGGGGHEGVVVTVRVRFSLTVSGKDGKEWGKQNTERIFKFPSGRWGWPTLVDKSHPLFRTWLRDGGDGFTIRCVLTVIPAPRVQDVTAVVVSEPSVLRDMAAMLRDDDGADVTFAVAGRSFPAHKGVLAARSAVFRAELFGPMKEKAERRVTVDDMEPSVFEALLHFVYTDSLPDDNDGGDDGDGGDAGGAGAADDHDNDTDKDKNNVAMQHLLVAADRYGLDRLRLMCEERMCRSIDAETVATTLALAEQHGCVQLKNACLGFMASRGVLGAVLQTSGFCHLAESCPSIVLEILDKLASLGI